MKLWIFSVVLISALGEESPCPKGGRIHLANQKCYWLSEMASSWIEALNSCKDTKRGDLADADSLELQTFIFYSFPVRSTVWVWLKGSEEADSDQAKDIESWETTASVAQMLCAQMALGIQGEWRKAPCSEQHLYLCEREVNEPVLSEDSYLIGVVFMTGIYPHTQIRPLTKFPDIGQLTVEMQLFPGIWFSHAGQLKSVDLVVQPSTTSSLARVQILRPYCNPNQHLVPPGCSSLLNPFSCCSAVPLCNTTGGCSRGQYWCHLLEACVCTACPCSPYDSAAGNRGFVLPPRYPMSPPFFHLVAELPLRINPSSDHRILNVLLPDQAITVYPDDIVAIQHTRSYGSFLHCLNSKVSGKSPWRQSYLSLQGTEWGSWWERGVSSLPKEGQWVDGVVCDLKMLYKDDLPRGTQYDDTSGFTQRDPTTAPSVWALTNTPALRGGFELTVIHPVPDQNNEIHVQTNVPTLVVVKVLSGENVRSSWSAPVHQTGVTFSPYCPEEVTEFLSDCKSQSHDFWFSSVTLVMPSEGDQTLDINVTNAVSSQSISLRIWSYQAVTGLSVEPQRCWRMLVDTPQLFVAKVESGTSVKFTWVIDDLDLFAHEGQSYSVVFKKPAEYMLKVKASNPVSSQNQQVFLTADEITPMDEPEFMLLREVVAVDATHLYSLRVKVHVSLPVNVRWDFGDGSREVIHTHSAPCLTMPSGLKRQQRDVYVQDTVNYTYSSSDDFKLHIQVSNQYNYVDAFMKICVRPKLIHLLVSSSLPVPHVKEPLFLEVSPEPFSHAIIYTWDFGDGSKTIQSNNHKVNHSFTSAGVYNITVCANNTLSALTHSLTVEVMEEISGLTLSYSRPAEINSPVDFRATVAAGTSLIWKFNFGDGSLQENLRNGSVSHIYKSPGNYTVYVTVLNSVSQALQSVSIEVYRLALSGVLPTECVMSGKGVQLSALVNGDASFLTFHWLIGDGSSLTVVRGQPTVIHRFQNQGSYPVGLTVISSVTSVSFNATLCVEQEITNVRVQSSSEVCAAGEEVCFQALVSPEQIRGCSFTWFQSPSDLMTRTENSQQCFTFKEEGVQEVTVIASNTVSNMTAKAGVNIQNPVGQLSVVHDSPGETLTVNKSVSFWVSSCTGSNVSVLWDFGDGTPVEQKQNTTHAFTSEGYFIITTTAFNTISRQSVTLKVNVLLPESDLSLYTDQPYSAVGEETLISAESRAISSTNYYYWSIDGVPSTTQGTNQFRFAFSKPGVFRVQVAAQDRVSRSEAGILIEVFERIEGLQIECQSVTDMKYVPTEEGLKFVASVTKGSNLTYYWLVTQTETNKDILGNGGSFYMIAESPGEVLVQVRASNKLGEVSSSVSLVAVERVVITQTTEQPNTVAAGKLVNISVSVLSGSDLQFLWQINSDVSPLQTNVPFLLHTFVNLGCCLVTVSAQNILSNSNVTMTFDIQEEVKEVDFEIEGKKLPFFIPSNAAVQLHGLIHKGNDLIWKWRIGSHNSRVSSVTNQTFIYTFPHAGIYQVSLNVSNQINWQHVSHSVMVLDAVEGLMVNISKSSVCTGEEVTFNPVVSKGSNVSFVMTFQNKDWTHSHSISKGQFTISSLPAGTILVRVTAINQVSSAEVTSRVHVTEQIQNLQLMNCSADLEALKGVQFKAEAQCGLPVTYTWIFFLEGSEPTQLTGQEVTFTPLHSGLLSLSVTATSGVCSMTLNNTSTVHWPLKQADIISSSERIFVGHRVMFTAAGNGWSNILYLWDFGDSSETLQTVESTHNHTYYNPGKYSVVVKASNRVSCVSAQLQVEVEELLCSLPQVSLIQGQSTIFGCRPNYFEARVDNSCSVYKTKYLWEVLEESDCVEVQVHPKSKFNSSSPLLLIPKHSLDVGQYCVVFTVSLQGTPLMVRKSISVDVVHSPLVAVIQGGSHRLWSSLRDLVLDGSGSRDPDVETGEDRLQYHWTVTTVGADEPHLLEQHLSRGNSSRLTVSRAQLHPGTEYVFILTIQKAGRPSAQVNQTVTVCDTPLLPVSVECVSCSILSSNHKASYNTPIFLSGKCEQCGKKKTKYEWHAEDQSGVNLDLNEVSTSTERNSADLVLRSGVLQLSHCYTFILNVSQPSTGQWGSASLTVRPNNPPHGGLCELSPETRIHLLETLVIYNCSGWRNDENEVSQLLYTLQVSPCQQFDLKCPLLTLYRGTRSSYGALVPVGHSGQVGHPSFIMVTLLVEDYLGTKVLALNRTLTVENPSQLEVSSHWLRDKSQTELQALVYRGNSQEIIPYSIAIISQLNQMESGQTAEDLTDRRETRKHVIQALTSLPVSSLLDVDQISSALSLSTVAPREMVCSQCLEDVLKMVQKMIQVMEEQRDPGVLSAVERGRNILDIIGNSLAALSISPQQTLSSTLQPASTVFLDVLGHTGTLMRSLMHAHVRGEAPLLLSLSSSYLNTDGFFGDPSDLLCTHQSSRNKSKTSYCQFHIPTAFTTYLKSQQSEVVQVLFSVDADTGPSSFLAAADPPISTTLAAMELTTSRGQPIPIQGLEPEHAIQITLANKHPVGLNNQGGDGGVHESRNRTCPTITLPTKGQLSFRVIGVDGLDKNAGLFISFNFSHDTGSASVSLGRVRIEVGFAVLQTFESMNFITREWTLTFSAATTSTEEAIFLSPYLNRTNEPLLVNLTSSLVDNSSVHVSVCVFSSLCQYYSVNETRWSSEGLQPLDGSTLHSVRCRTRHLTLFGASMFVHPGAVILLPPSSGPVRNMVVGIICAILVLVHILMGLFTGKLDHLDSLRLSQVPLCGQPGLYHYRVLVKTGRRRGAGTTAHVGICLYGVTKSGSRHLQRVGAFQRGSLDQFHLETDDNLGEIWKIRIWHDNTGLDPSWYVQHVVVWDPQTDHMFFFLLEDWLSVDDLKTSGVEREVLASCPEELHQFQRVLFSQLMFGMVEYHLWLSLWGRPAHNRFTRCQRVTCSALVLHLYMALGALWYSAVGTEGHRGPVSTQLLLNMETIAVGFFVALLVFPLHCLLCFLFRKCNSQVVKEISAPSSPVCHSEEICSPSLLSFPDSSGPVQESAFSLVESELLDSSILDFWATSGLVAQTDDRANQGETWQSCDSLLSLPVDPCLTKTSPPKQLSLSETSPTVGPSHQLRRRKALMQPCRSSSSPTVPTTASRSLVCTDPLSKGIFSSLQSPTTPGSKVSASNTNSVQTYSHNLTTLLTLSEEDLLMSIAAASEDAANVTNSNSDSGWDSPRTTSLLSHTWSSSWSQQSEEKLFFGDVHKPDPLSCPSLTAAGLQKCPSVLSVDSVASTFLPNLSTESSHSCSSTRIGVARGKPGWLLPHWVLCVIYPMVSLLLGTCLTVVGVYGSYMSRTVVTMWLISVLSAFFSSALLLEPLKVCIQSLISTTLWRPVDPEVEEQLALESTVVRASREHGGNVRPPCGYGLLQAKEEARKVRALQSLMRQCVCQLFFLLLVLMVNYQDSMERRQGRLLHLAVRHQLHSAPVGVHNLTSLKDWSDAEQWINHTLVPHLHQSPSLQLVGLPQLQYTLALSPLASYFWVDHNATNNLHEPERSKKQLKSLSIHFTLAHRESAIFLCVSIHLDWAQTHQVTPFLSIHPFLIPSTQHGLDLQTALMVLLLISGLLLLFGELRSISAESAGCLYHSLFQLFLALLSLATAILYFCFLSLATSSVSKPWSYPNDSIDLHSAAHLSQMCSQCAAVLLTLLVLQLLGAFRFVQRWVVLGRVLQRAWRELWALAVLLLLLLLLCTHLRNILFSDSLEGSLTAYQSRVSVLSLLCSRKTRQRVYRVHTILGPFYGLLIVIGGLWLLARLCGAVLIHAYRAEQAELYRPAIGPQDYEMVEFFIKRLKLWMGLTKAKEFRHRVKFEGMDMSPSRSSQDSRLSTRSPVLSSPYSPSICSSSSPQRPLSSALSVRSEDSSVSESGTSVQPYFDHLLPCVTSLLSHFDQVNQITEDIYDLEKKLEEAQTKRRERLRSDNPKRSEKIGDLANPTILETGEGEHRKAGFFYSRPRVSLPSALAVTPYKVQNSSASTCIFPRTRSAHSESDSVPYQLQLSRNHHTFEAASEDCGSHPAASPGFIKSNRRRAWHSGSSCSADAVQRSFLTQAGVSTCGSRGEDAVLTKSRPSSEQGMTSNIRDGVPVRRKAWISEQLETEIH
ncbi:polycystin-1 [Xyrichtys novacula]|uniref:Polycystin-1 n=1 Tax=Xyrichtys novacula TaxID=13765 RepID=A0AAV1H6W5_XYRNO|nr:polycystin-1 [Xyrichtys novacula]